MLSDPERVWRAVIDGDQVDGRDVLSLVQLPRNPQLPRQVIYPEVAADLLKVDRILNLVEEGIDVALRIGDLPPSDMMAVRDGETALLSRLCPRQVTGLACSAGLAGLVGLPTGGSRPFCVKTTEGLPP
ncbi:hypothetical protein [Roseicyclus mahoneyensis]|uniref:hypothetical protein n=1 Tax=Roseicyclus mahoneyensis TaxID=164332 RepID=UPI0011B20E54|nr:hypothetical protein [Roseicyclus mahoneyensis]